MLFRRNIEPRCQYCKFGSSMNEREVACVKKGVVAPESHCRRFSYDPLKRMPSRPIQLDTSRLKEEDFSI